MSVDQRLRDGLRFERSEQRLALERLIPLIESRVSRRRRIRMAAVVAAAACLLAVLALIVSPVADRSRSVPPVEPTRTTDTPQIVSVSPVCDTAIFTCVDGRPVSATMGVEVRWARLDTFTGEVVYVAGDDQVLLVELWRSDTTTDQYAGVSLAQHVRAPSLVRTGRVDPDVHNRAEDIARWLADRPDLRTSAVRAGRVDGRPAWSVDVKTKVAERDARVTCNDTFACTPIIHVAGGGARSTQGVFKGLANTFTFVDVPGAGVVAIWSWALPGRQLLAGNQSLVDSVRFDPPAEP